MIVSPVGTAQRVLVICIKWSGVATTRLATAADWVALLNTQVNTYYNRATYNQTNFVFETVSGGPTDGWYDIGYAATSYDYYRTGQDAINLAAAHADLSRYNRILVITNWPDFGGQGASFNSWLVSEGVEYSIDVDGTPRGARAMSLSIVNEWVASDAGEPGDAAVAVVIHELGHHLDLATHYARLDQAGGTSRDVVTPWDVMGFSPFVRHFLAWAKAERGWIGAGAIRTVTVPTTSDIVDEFNLSPNERPPVIGAFQLGLVPFTPSTVANFMGYSIENRQRVLGDENLPSAGVLIGLVRNTAEVPYGFKEVVQDNVDTGDFLNNAALAVGGSYTDASRGIRISVLSQTGETYRIRVEYPRPPTALPAPTITAWGAPDWETPDIWIDSEKNGWDTYRYTDAGGNPTGNGDDAWVNHANRVYVQIRNAGAGVATNVRVRVYVNQPPGMGDAGPDWAFIGEILYPSVPAGGAPVRGYVVWTPTVGAHTCIRAVIQEEANYLPANRAAQENVTHFDTTSSSPYKPVGQKVQVFNPNPKEKTPVHFDVRNVPPGWGVKIEPRELTLGPGEAGWVYFEVHPSGFGGKDPGTRLQKQLQRRYMPGFVGRVGLAAFVPFEDTFIPIGGVDHHVRLTVATKITVQVGRDKRGVRIAGRLYPALADRVVAVVIQGRKARTLHARTNAEGEFALGGGRSTEAMTVTAYYAGDTVYGPSESDPVAVRTDKAAT